MRLTRRLQTRPRVLLCRGLSLGLALALGLVALPSVAEAAVSDKPARTWGIGPALATSVSEIKPRVLAILPVGDRVFVGGTFDSVIDPSGVSYPVKNLAVFSASTGAADLSFAATTNNTVTSLASDGGSTLFVGGTFSTVNGVARKGLAAVDQGSGIVSGWNPTVSTGQVDSVAYWGGSVYAGGSFSSVTDTSISSNPYLAKVDATTGSVDGAWSPAPSDRVRALNVAADGSGRLFIGGDFLSVSSVPKTNKLAAVSLTGSGGVDAAFKAGPTNGTAYSMVFDLTSDGSRVYAAAGGAGGACAALTSSTGTTLWSDRANGNLQSVRLSGGSLYCGGHFSGADSFSQPSGVKLSRQKLAEVDPATGVVTGFDPQINSAQGTWALGADATHLFVGGDFSAISGVSQPHFAMFTDAASARAPQPPSGPRAEPGDAVVHLSWTAPSSDGGSPLLKYKIYRATTPGGQQLTKAPLVTLSNDVRTFADSLVTNGDTYYYVVVATNALGASLPSAEVAATPSGSVVVSPPGAPTSVSATNPAGYNHLQWNPPTVDGGAPVTSYRIYRASGAGQQSAVLVGTVSTTSFNDVYQLLAGSTYYYTVTAVNTAGEGPRSAEVSALTTPGTPGPAQLTGALGPAGTVQLSWTLPPDGGSAITKYVVLRDGIRLASMAATTSGPTAYTDKTAAGGSTYVYQVRGVNAYGNGQLSNKATVTLP